jgi:hypothetical protein
LFFSSDAWGSLVKEKSFGDRSKHIKVPSLISRVSSLFSKSASQDEVTADLVKELGKVRSRVYQEYQILKGLRTRNEEKDSVALAKRKRLLYLFVKDLSSGVSGEVLSGKSQRDSRLSGKLDRVSWWRKAMAGLFVALLDIGMLLYVYLFAMSQTSSRQQAWFFSFVMWLGFEIFLSSTALVLVLHLLIPLYVWSDVAEVKKKVLTDLIEFREKYLNMNSNDISKERENDIETGMSEDFNAAKYLFPSWRVASLFLEEIPESPLVLRFSTPWPKKRFGKEEGNVAKEYEDDVLLATISRILLYFLTSLLNYSSLVQDIFIQTTCNASLGYLLVLLVRLWNVYPWLAGLVVLVLSLCAYGLGKYSLNELAKKLEESERGVESPTGANSADAHQVIADPVESSIAAPQEHGVPPAVPPLPTVAQDPSPRWGSSGEKNEVDHFFLGVCIWESESSSDDTSIFDRLSPEQLTAPQAIISPHVDVSILAERSNEEEEEMNQEDEDDEHFFVEGRWISKSPQSSPPATPDDCGDSDGSVRSEESSEDDEKDDDSSSEGVPSLSQYFWNSDFGSMVGSEAESAAEASDSS